MAEHGRILKNNQNTHYPRFSFKRKTGVELPKAGVSVCIDTKPDAVYWSWRENVQPRGELD